MKNTFYVLFILTLFISCGKEKTVEEELVGDWVYERETFNNFSTLEDLDTAGFITLRADETGDWSPSFGSLNFSLEWDLQAMDSKIAITRTIDEIENQVPATSIYDITRNSEDSFSLRFHHKFESPIDTLDDYERFENIILTRI